MALSKQEFLVLKELAQSSTVITRSNLDVLTGLTSLEVDAAFISLEDKGFVANRRITFAGGEALEPYRIKNAIIMAAGMCTRFAPISYDMPKGLVEVKGEVLIERMIRQLHEVGIYDIVLVVGHNKDMYAYLGPKYGVTFVENPEYALTNTCTSLFYALDYLSRSYILYSDNYFNENPFERYIWEGFYGTKPIDGPTKEWCFLTDDDGYVTDMELGHDSGESAAGISVLDETIVDVLAPLIRAEQDNWTAKQSYWETVWQWNTDKVKIRTRLLPKNFSFEFDSMDDLYAFDPDYLNRVVSPSLDNICTTLACKREQVHDCYPLVDGLANVSCHFAVGEREYVYRHPVGIGGRFCDRADEAKIEAAALRLGLDKTFIYEDPGKGWKISRFIPNARHADRENRDDHRVMAKMIGELHRLEGLSSQNFSSVWGLAVHFENNLKEMGVELPEWYVRGRDKGVKLYEYALADGFPKVFSHNDCWYSNYLVDEDGNYNLIDWEYAMMADEGDDFGYMTATVFAERAYMEELMEIYLGGRKPTELEYRHYAAHTMHAAVYQAAFTLAFKYSAVIPTDWPIDLWLELMEKYLEDNMDWVLALYEGPEAE